MIDAVPPLREQRGLDAIGVGDQHLETGLEVQQHEFGIEFESEGVAEGGSDREPAQVIGRAADSSEFKRTRCGRRV